MKMLKKNRILPYYYTAILALCLTGCMGIYEGGFECPAGVGVGCKSISDVNTMVNQHSVPSIQYPEKSAEIWYAPRSSVQYSVSSIQKETPSNSDKACPSTMERKKGARSLDANSI